MGEAFPGCSSFIRASFIQRGFPEAGFKGLLNSISEGTRRQYGVCFKKWWSFSIRSGISPFIYNFGIILEFLNEHASRDVSYSLVNTYSSALHFVFDFTPRDDKVLKRFLKGIERCKPQRSRYSEIWDPSPVLELLSSWFPLETLPLQKLTFKLVTLLCLVTAHRLQTLSKIRLSNIKTFHDRIEILISDVIKTTFCNKAPPVLILPFFNDRPDLCIARTLEAYLNQTLQLRSSNSEFLILTLKAPVHPASPQTLSRWVKSVLRDSGIDVSVFSGYSTRHASTSAAFRAGVDLEEIRRTAGWTEKSTTFNKFYNRPLVKKTTFADRMLRNCVIPDSL